MARTKLKRLQKIYELKNVFNIKDPNISEKLKNYFYPNKTFTLEIGCGHGDNSVQLAQRFPGRNFIGVDVKGARIYKGAIKSLELELNNVAFVLAKAEKLNEVFKPKSIEEIYIPFPEPHVKRANENRRLISPDLIKLYKELLMDSGLIHFKTDNSTFYEYAIQNLSKFDGKILHCTEDLYNDDSSTINSGIISTFEQYYINKGVKIKYICSSFN